MEESIILSPEIVDNIFKYLSIKDIEDFIEFSDIKPKSSKYVTTRSTCLNSYADRINIVKYLNKYFVNGKYLLDCMFTAGCVITGSRALEIFVPGSITSESDWNFFVMPSSRSILHMAEVLRKLGVEWQLGFNALYESAKRLDIPRSEVDKVIHSIEEDDTDRGYIYSEYMEELRYKEFEKFNTIFRTETLTGTLTRNNKITTIRLTYSTDYETPLKLIKRMNHSAIQCFISQIGIGHLYYTNTCKKETFVWSDIWNWQTPQNQHFSRGYQKLVPIKRDMSTPVINRSLSDKYSKFINLIEHEDDNFIAEDILTSCWYQFNQFIEHYNSPIETLHESRRRDNYRYRDLPYMSKDVPSYQATGLSNNINSIENKVNTYSKLEVEYNISDTTSYAYKSPLWI